MYCLFVLSLVALTLGLGWVILSRLRPGGVDPLRVRLGWALIGGAVLIWLLLWLGAFPLD